MKMLKLLQEMKGFSEMARLHPAPKPSALFLMQLRHHMTGGRCPKRRLSIAIDLRDVATIPTPVKITHIVPAFADRSA